MVWLMSRAWLQGRLAGLQMGQVKDHYQTVQLSTLLWPALKIDLLFTQYPALPLMTMSMAALIEDNGVL